MVAADRNAGRVNLRVARVGEERAALVGAPGRRDVRVHGVGRQVIHRPVAAGGQDDGVAGVLLDRAGRQVADDDAARLAVDDDQVEHLAAGEELTLPLVHLPHQRLVGAEQQLLTRLAAGVERARHLRAAERPVVEQAAVLARERHALRHALVDDVHAQLGQAVDVGFARPVVAALDGVVEQAVHAVAVVLVVLRRVDAALRRDAVGAPGAVLDAEVQDVVAELAERGGGRRRPPGRCRRTMMVYFRLFAGLTSFISNLCRSHLSAIGSAGNVRVQRDRAHSGASHEVRPQGDDDEAAGDDDGGGLAGREDPRRPARMVGAERLQRARPRRATDASRRSACSARRRRPSAGCGSSPSPVDRGRARRSCRLVFGAVLERLHVQDDEHQQPEAGDDHRGRGQRLAARRARRTSSPRTPPAAPPCSRRPS